MPQIVASFNRFYHVVPEEFGVKDYLTKGIKLQSPYEEPGVKAIYLWDNVEDAMRFGEVKYGGGEEGDMPFAILEVTLPKGAWYDVRTTAMKGAKEYIYKKPVPSNRVRLVYSQVSDVVLPDVAHSELLGKMKQKSKARKKKRKRHITAKNAATMMRIR